MNARVAPIDKFQKLSREQMNRVVDIALRNEPHAQKVERLRKITFCTDEVKFLCIKVSRRVPKELYQCLHDLYFGTAEGTPELFEPKPIETYSDEMCTPAEELPQGEPVTVPEEQHRKYRRLTQNEIERFIECYKSGMSVKEISDKFGLTQSQTRQKIADFKRRGKLKGMTEVQKAEQESRNTKFEEIINSVDAGRTKDTEDAVKLTTEAIKKADAVLTEPVKNLTAVPKAFTASGKGFLTTDGGLKLDEEPITSLIRQVIISKGLMQFYADVEIVITPSEPTGMTVQVEE